MSHLTTHNNSKLPSSSNPMLALSRVSPSAGYLLENADRGAGSAQRLGQHSPIDNSVLNASRLDRQTGSPNKCQGEEPEKHNGMGKGTANGGTEEKSDKHNSTASGQNDDDDDDDDDGDKPAVKCPADMNSKSEIKDFDQHISAGLTKRTFEEAELEDVTAQDEDEPDYPRKKLAKHISATTQGILTYSEPLSLEDYKTDDDNDEMAGYDYDENITDEEEAAIIHEFNDDADELGDVQDVDTDMLALVDLETGDMNHGIFDDLDSELFDAMCNDPHRFDDIRQHAALDWNPFTAESDNDLFTDHPTPAVTPESTPRPSHSVPIQPLESLSSEDEDDEEDDAADLNPFFEADTAAIKHLVSTTGKGGWSDETDDDADLLKYFFSSCENTSEEAEDDSDIESEDGDTTDEEEDLPMPTPTNASKLRRVSISSNMDVRPQIVDTNHEGPELCSWVADPSRPICVIEGTKQTFLIPEAYKNLNVVLGNTAPNQWIPLEESESEQSTNPTSFDPTLSSLLGLGGGMNGGDILGPPEAFYPFLTEGADYLPEMFVEEDYDVDEFEAGLEIDDFLDLSSEEDVNEDSKEKERVEEGLSDGCDECGEDDECVGSTSTDMLSIWDKVSVTAFRKRQVLHKLAAVHGSQHGGGTGCHKGKEGRLSETITPTKKRRVRKKFLASSRESLVGGNAALKHKLTR